MSLCNSLIQPNRSWAPSTTAIVRSNGSRALLKCSPRLVATATKAEAYCRHFFARDTSLYFSPRQRGLMCGGETSLDLEFVYGGTRETVNVGEENAPPVEPNAEYPSLLQANRSASLVVMGFGIWHNFEPAAVLARLRAHLRLLGSHFGAPPVVWVSADARHRSDYAMQSNERATTLNSFMEKQLRLLQQSYAGQLYYLSTFELTRASEAIDGTHYPPEVNRLKVALLLRFLQSRMPSSRSVASHTRLTRRSSPSYVNGASSLALSSAYASAISRLGRLGRSRRAPRSSASGGDATQNSLAAATSAPTRHTSRAYIICLLGPLASDVQDATEMVKSLKFFLDNYSTPLVIFHETNQPADVISRLGSLTPRHVISAVVDFSAVPRLTGPKISANAMHGRSGWGYMHMINFFFQGIFIHPALADADFVMRMDCDSVLKAPMLNLFALMESEKYANVSYIALSDNRDCGELVADLPKLAVQFASSSAGVRNPRFELKDVITQAGRRACWDARDACFNTQNPLARKCCCMIGYYNNFELLRMRDFRSNRVRVQWSDTVTKTQGIYRHRWGDAILRRVGLELMNSKVLFLDQVSPYSEYCHRGFCYGTPGSRPTMATPVDGFQSRPSAKTKTKTRPQKTV